MVDQLFPLLKKPALWQRSAEAFWDDEHISKGMLEAHLNPDWDAASRKHQTIAASVAWLAKLIPAKSRILDLGCGPGLYTKGLADLGYDMTGMDLSRRSIAYARSRDTKTQYILQNYLELDQGEAFDAITLIYCDYAALTPKERCLLLQRVGSALKPGGLFILDVFTQKHFSAKARSSTWTLCESGGFWSPKPHLCLEATHLYEENQVEVRQTVVISKAGLKEYLFWDTAYSAQSMAQEVTPFGFRVKGVFDDVCGSPYTGEGEVLCFLIEKP